MKFFFYLLLLFSSLEGKEVDLYATLGILSHHFTTREDGTDFNGKHDAFGAEMIFDEHYTLAYLHFINSRDKTTEIYAGGYRYDIYGNFGIYGVIGYQHGYCFNGIRSVECTEGQDNSGLAFLPMLYYRHPWFILDIIPQGNMIALKLNLKLF